MKTDLKDQQTTPNRSHDERKPARSKKAPYASPTFRIYGSVSALTRGGGGSLFDGHTEHHMSDRRTKENIGRIGTHPLGIGLYLFDYKPLYREQWGCSRQFGVMADEVEAVMPEAVGMHPNGYKMVNYAMLGIERAVH